MCHVTSLSWLIFGMWRTRFFFISYIHLTYRDDNYPRIALLNLCPEYPFGYYELFRKGKQSVRPVSITLYLSDIHFWYDITPKYVVSPVMHAFLCFFLVLTKSKDHFNALYLNCSFSIKCKRRRKTSTSLSTARQISWYFKIHKSNPNREALEGME